MEGKGKVAGSVASRPDACRTPLRHLKKIKFEEESVRWYWFRCFPKC